MTLTQARADAAQVRDQLRPDPDRQPEESRHSANLRRRRPVADDGPGHQNAGLVRHPEVLLRGKRGRVRGCRGHFCRRPVVLSLVL
jgi:hypothetical protein